MKKFLIAFLFACFSGAAMAQQSAPSFDEVDSNADGDVSQSELEAASVTNVDIASSDQDGDGTLSQDEYESATGSSGGSSTGGGAMGGESDFGTQEESTIP